MMERNEVEELTKAGAGEVLEELDGSDSENEDQDSYA